MVELCTDQDETCVPPKMKLAKILSSPDKMKREKAMSLIGIWLASQKEVNEEDLSKIWKGVFYCLRQAAKLPVQEANLIERVSDLINKLDLELSFTFFKTFLTTLANELEAVDVCSSDSFYILLTQNVSSMLSVLQVNGWELEMIKSFMGAVFQRSVLSQEGVGIEKVNMHITDIFLYALREFFPIPVEAFTQLLEPFVRVLEEGCNKIVAERICAGIFLPICESGCRKLEGKSMDCKDGFLADVALSFPLLAVVQNILTTQESHFVLEEMQAKLTDLENLLLSKSAIVTGNQPSSMETTSTADTGIEDPSKLSILSPQHHLKFRKFGCRARRNHKRQKMQDMLLSEPQDCLVSCIQDGEQAENIQECIHVRHVDGQAGIGKDDSNSVEDSIVVNLRITFDGTHSPEGSLYSTPLASSPLNAGIRKRKRCMFLPLGFDNNDESPTSSKENGMLSHSESTSNQNTSSKKAKKVHFSLQHNLVWRPSTPLPPHDVRVPPGATPRGSALKKGVPPGPIVDLDISPLVSQRRKRRRATPRKITRKGTGRGSRRAKKSPLSPQ